MSEATVHGYSTLVNSQIVTPSAYVLFYKRRGFNLDKPEDFENIKCVPSGMMDHLLEKTKQATPTKSELEEQIMQN